MKTAEGSREWKAAEAENDGEIAAIGYALGTPGRGGSYGISNELDLIWASVTTAFHRPRL